MLPLLQTKEITVIFANIEDLLITNTVSHESFRVLFPALTIYFVDVTK